MIKKILKFLILLILISGATIGAFIFSYQYLFPTIQGNNAQIGGHNSSSANNVDNVTYFYKKPIGQPSKVNIVIIKSKRALELFGDGQMLGRFKVDLGFDPAGDKVRQGDGKTPTGNFYLCTRMDKSKYKYFLGISYPNKEDAKRGFKDKIITKSDLRLINKEIDHKQKPSWSTALGGAVGIHGANSDIDRSGCITLSEQGIDVLWKYAKMGTPVKITE